MTRPATSPSRVLLVADRTTAPGRAGLEGKIRRYRLARVQLDGRQAAVDRHAHLRRSHD